MRRWLLLLVVVLFAQGYLLQNVFPALLALLLLLYTTYLSVEFSPVVEASREMESELVEGEEEEVRLRVNNLDPKEWRVTVREGSLPPGFEASPPEPFTLGPREERVLEYPIVPVKGSYEIGPPRLELSDPQGVNSTRVEEGSWLSVVVYASLDRLREEAMADENLRVASSYASLPTGLLTMEVDSLRDFQEGDELRHIEWKATARRGKLIIKDFLREVDSDIYVVVDTGREMRKGMKNSKVDYAGELALSLATLLSGYRVGLIVYDEGGVVSTLEPSKSFEQVRRFATAIRPAPVYSGLLGVKLRGMSFELSRKGRSFLERVMPALKGRGSHTSGLSEAAASLPHSAYAIFISDITSNTGELVRVLSTLRARLLLLTPNPILFYDPSKLDSETMEVLYRSYLEREETVRRLNTAVPTFDLGPSDLKEMRE